MAKEWGLAPETLLVSGTNDQYAGALGAGNYRPGILSETSGTCLAMVTLTKKRPTALSSGWFHGCFPIPGYWFIMAFSKTSGVVLDWFRETMASGVSFDDLNKAAAKVPIGSKGLCMVPHFDGMISPVPNQRVRGAFAGLTLGHDRAHLYRSILEGLTFNLVANLKLMQARGMEIEVIRSIGGGATNPLWLQMKADVAGLPVELPAVPEAATLGAAMLAAYGRGDYESLEDTSRQLYHCRQVIKPNPANQALYQQAYENYNRIMERMLAVYA
jgi:xylulokinase